MVVLIDNYDSFTYNLFQAVRALGAPCKVVRNDAVTVGQVKAMKPKRLILSPGPGRPEDAGITVSVLKTLSAKIPTLGVCLGHQAMGLAFGGKVVGAKRLMHGKTCRIRHDRKGLYTGLEQNVEVMRYHSLVIEESTLPKCLVPVSHAQDGTLMGVRHASLPIEGVQFHPESVMTPEGVGMIRNFLNGAFLR
jgi:anthranilate synthase/aminodeoxychorismate synthase-like glutamine amidotransferase